MIKDSKALTELINSENGFYRLLFWPIIAAPVVITPILFAFASGDIETENHVILYFFILVFYRVLFLLFFFLNNRSVNFVIHKRSIKKDGLAEKIISTPINGIIVDGEEIKFSALESKLILKHSQQIVKMKLIVLLGIVFDITTFLLIGLTL